MKKISPKNIEVLKEVLEKELKQKVITTKIEGDLTCLYFPGFTKIPNSMIEMREELKERGYILFYSQVLDKNKENVLSVNLSKC